MDYFLYSPSEVLLYYSLAHAVVVAAHALLLVLQLLELVEPLLALLLGLQLALLEPLLA